MRYEYNPLDRTITLITTTGDICVQLERLNQETLDHAAMIGIAQRLRGAANPRAEAARLMSGEPWMKGRG